MSPLRAPCAPDDQIRCLVETTRVLERSEHAEAALDEIGDHVVVSTCADLAVVALLNDDGQLRPVALRHTDQELCGRFDLLERILRPAPTGIVEAAMLGRAALVEDLDEHAQRLGATAETRRALQVLGARSAVACPVIGRGQVLGVLLVATNSQDRTFTPSDRELLCEVASRAGQALASERLTSTLRVAEQRFAAAFEFAPIGMALMTKPGRKGPAIAEANPALCAILGRHADALIGRRLADFLHPDEPRGPGGDGERRFVRPDGEVRVCAVQSAALDDDGSVVCQLVDVTAHRRSEDELVRLVTHDRLTGLLNRGEFERVLSDAVEVARRQGQEGAVAIFDLDHFGVLNDTYGAAAGDALLRLVGRTLCGRLRTTDAVGRIGDDEFGVVFAGTSCAAAAGVAAELVECIRRIAMPAGTQVIRPTVSAGISTFAHDGRRGPAELIADADAAVQDAKEQGRDRLCTAHESTRTEGRSRSQRRWSERIRRALEQDRLVLYEQPILAIRQRRVVRSEVLVRMIDENGRIVPPGAFLPAAERFAQMTAIDRRVIARALELLRARAAQGVDLPLNVNLSGESLSDPTFVRDIIGLIERSGVDGRRLTFEVTETAALRDVKGARDSVARLSALGCGVGLDDFGTGFSSFAYLKQLPVDSVKIDGQFVRDLAIDPVDRLTVQAIVDVSRGAGATTTAEYVEDEVTLCLLDHLGVDYAQGHHIGRPRPARPRPEWLLR